jgi:TonB-dependent Receptor Plug Domain
LEILVKYLFAHTQNPILAMQKIYKLNIIVAVAFSFFGFENDWLEKVIGQLEAFQTSRPPEKLYLHTDRSYYAISETIWFKAYLVEGGMHNLDTISKIGYVDLVEKATDKTIAKRKIKLVNGAGASQIELPDSLATGEYTLKGYTQWMRNFEEDFWFKKDITIFNTDTPTLPSKLPANADKLNVNFYPEGGHLLMGVDNRVAFEASTILGKNIDIEGFILESNKDTLVGFVSQHEGRGSFVFKPESDKEYTIVVKKPTGGYQKMELPAIKKTGFTVTVDNLTNKDNLRVYVRYQKAEGSTGSFALVAHTRGIITHVARGTMTKPTAIVMIPKNILADGITHLTLFNDKGLPECERLLFMKPTKKLNITLSTNKTTYQKRELAELEINTTDENGKPISSDLSLAVTDISQVVDCEADKSNILSYMLLESDLKEAVPNAAAYFDSQNIQSASQIDLLLLTRGWRRFKWADVLSGTPPAAKYPVEQSLMMTGKVLRPNQKSPGVVNLTFMVTAADSSKSLVSGQSNENGEFMVDGIDFKDQVTVLIQAVTQKGNRNLIITLDDIINSKTKIIKTPYNPIEFNANELSKYLENIKNDLSIERKIKQSNEKILDEVTVKAKKYVAPDSRKIYGEADATIGQEVLKVAGGQTVLDVIAGRIAGVSVTGSGSTAVVQIRGAANFSGVTEPLFLLDGIIVDKSTITSISLNDVEEIDVIKNGAKMTLYGSQGSGGAIAVLTKRGNANYNYASDAAQGVLVANLTGYSAEKVFAAPNYNSQTTALNRPDTRPTVYWQPHIRTDSTGKAHLKFRLNDAQANLRLRAEGLDGKGRMGAVIHTVEGGK